MDRRQRTQNRGRTGVYAVSNTITGVVIDKREPPWVHELDFGALTGSNILNAGDLWVATSDNQMLIIERKTPSDFLNSIADNRALNQTAKMRKISDWCYVVVTGSLPFDPKTRKMISGQKVTGWGVNAVQGFIRTLRELGVFVEQCASDGVSTLFPDARYIVLGGNEENDFASHVIEMAGRNRDEVHIHPVRQPHILSPGEALLVSLPGIGWEKARALLDFCDTPAWALNYLTTLGKDGVPGVGDGIKRAVRHALELEDGAELWPIAGDENEKDS